MVHRSADSRLLANLIVHEKDYTKNLHSLLDISHASFNSLTAYAASSPPPASQIILSMASSLSSADIALRAYAAAVGDWTRYLKELKDLEDDVSNVMRDREILVTRLLKASKSSPKPSSNRESFSVPDSASTLSLKSTEDPSTTYAATSFFSNITSGPTSANKKMQAAQAELQACEAHLANKELELEAKRSSAIRDGLRIRFRALAQCGWRWTEVGKEVEVVLGLQLGSQERPSSPSVTNKPLPVLHSPVPVHAQPPTAEFDRPSSDLSSIAPSQSASQVGVIIGSPPPASPLSHLYSRLEATSHPSPSSTPTNSSQAHTDNTSLHIPPAHSIDDHTLPTVDTPATTPSAPILRTQRHVLPRRITEEDLALQGQEDASEGTDIDSEDDHLPSDTQVIENPRFSAQKTKVSISSTSPTNHSGQKGISMSASSSGSGSGFFGSIRGLFTRHGKASSDRDRGDPVSPTSAASHGTLADDSSIDSQQPRGRGRDKKPRIGLMGRNKKKAIAGLFSDDEDGNGSVMSSPPAPLRSSATAFHADLNGSTSDVFSTPRARTTSDIHPSEIIPSAGRKLRKTGPRGKTVSNDLADGELKERRRSASLDYGDLSINGKTRRRKSRAEEWVDDQQEDDDGAVHARTEDDSHDAEEDEGRVISKTKSSVQRRRSSKHRSLPASNSTSALVLPPIPSASNKPSYVPSSAPVSRNSSIRSAASAPSGSNRRGDGVSGRSMSLLASSSSSSTSTLIQTNNQIQKHNARAGGVDVGSSSMLTSSSSTLTAHNASSTGSNLASAAPVSTNKTERRASSPVIPGATGTSSVGEGSVSLMSIVEDVAKTNREAWNKQGGSSTTSGTTLTSNALVGKSIGGTIKPLGLLEFVKAPKSIDLGELKEQMDKELSHGDTKTNRNHHTHPSSAASSSSELTVVLAAMPVVTSLPVPANRPSKAGSGQISLPLRSALKNPSRTPSPMLPASTSGPQQQQSLRTGSPVPKMPNGDYKGKGRADLEVVSSPAASAFPPSTSAAVGSRVQGVSQSGSGSDSDESDTASVSSYETGHEVFAEEAVENENDEDIKGERPAIPPKHDESVISQPKLLSPNSDAKPNRALGGSGSDISGSSTSTATPRASIDVAGPSANPSTPRRRKSVRVSLQPTFSVTPPAIDDDDEYEEHNWPRYGPRSPGVGGSTSGSDRDGTTSESSQRVEKNMWADSSDEDVEYQRARKLLGRVSSSKKVNATG